ncbi:MAG: 2-hydroxyacid dehydrogenase [Thermoplasmata archaeon]
MEVFVTRKIPEIGLNKVKEKFETEINPHPRMLKKEEIIEGVKGKDALLCLLTDEIDEEIIEAGEDLKVISNYAVGYDNIDVEAANERRIAVTNTPGVLTEATAEMAWSLIFAVVRNIVKGDKYVREDKFEGWDPTLMIGHEVHNKTLGVIGMGNIGSCVARKSKAFDMDVLYYNRSRRKNIEKEIGAEYVDKESLLSKSDIVTLHVPLTDETEEMISWEELDTMKESSYLINTARGEVVNEEALIETLRENGIGGAGIDVYSDEPYGANPNYYDLDNVVLTPHLGSASHRARDGMSKMAADNLIAVLEGRMPENIVNPEVLEE